MKCALSVMRPTKHPNFDLNCEAKSLCYQCQKIAGDATFIGSGFDWAVRRSSGGRNKKFIKRVISCAPINSRHEIDADRSGRSGRSGRLQNRLHRVNHISCQFNFKK